MKQSFGTRGKANVHFYIRRPIYRYRVSSLVILEIQVLLDWLARLLIALHNFLISRKTADEKKTNSFRASPVISQSICSGFSVWVIDSEQEVVNLSLLCGVTSMIKQSQLIIYNAMLTNFVTR